MLARLALGWERVWPALWPMAGVGGGFLALALLDVLPWLPDALHAVVLAVGAGALTYAASAGFEGFRWPSDAEALRRLERDSGLAHRPLTALRDRPATATGDAVAMAVWQAHCRALIQRTATLKVRWPRPNLAARDPWALRAVVGVVLVAVAAGSWGDWSRRLLAALYPGLERPGASVAVAFDVWLAPPDYTGLAPLFLHRAVAESTGSVGSGGDAAALAVPAGSVVLARASGGDGVPMLKVNDHEILFSAVDADHFQTRDVVRTGTEIAITQGGRTLGHWDIAVTPERAPIVGFTRLPTPSDAGALRLDYQATDDYGIAGMTLTVVPTPNPDGGGAADADAGTGTGAAAMVPLALPALNQRSVHASSLADLTASPWAGQRARLQLMATDTAGHKGVSEVVTMVLPERRFTNPVAQRIAAQRRILAEQGESARTAVAAELAELSVRPAGFQDDAVVFLALRFAVAQLLRDHAGDVLSTVRSLLWDTALRLEDGGVALAERELGEAERALTEALDRNAPEAELRQRMDVFQAAVDHFLDVLERQGAQTIARSGGLPRVPDLPVGALAAVIDRTDLEAMMKALRDLSETGARAGARQMLDDLHQALQGLGAGSAAQSLEQARMMDALHQLEAITNRQQHLLDRSYRQANPDPTKRDGTPESLPAQSPKSADQGEQGEQNALRQELGAVMQQLGTGNDAIPRPLGEAERAMRRAEQALQTGVAGAAGADQARALDHLQQGIRSLRQSLADPLSGDDGRDPLGRLRPRPGIGDAPGVHVPEQRAMQRSREILDELRRRAGQHERSREELDYIDRLLHPF